MTLQGFIFGMIIIIATLATAYVVGIVCMEYLKFPAPKFVNKKLYALVTGIAVIIIIAATIAELL